MEQVKSIVLRAAGINCDVETQYALELAGAQADRVHINRVIEDKTLLDEYQILVCPGGFSYGDDVAAGKILVSSTAGKIYFMWFSINSFCYQGTRFFQHNS